MERNLNVARNGNVLTVCFRPTPSSPPSETRRLSSHDSIRSAILSLVNMRLCNAEDNYADFDATMRKASIDSAERIAGAIEKAVGPMFFTFDAGEIDVKVVAERTEVRDA